MSNAMSGTEDYNSKPAPLLKVLTQSSLRAFRKCPRLYMHTYVNLYRSATSSEGMSFGTIWHNVREIYWNAIRSQPREVGDSCPAEAMAYIANLDDEVADAFDKAKFWTMLGGYHQRWHELLLTFDIIGVEQGFQLDLINPATKRLSRTFSLEGKLDGVVRERDTGLLWVVEEKTAKGDLQPDSQYWRRLEVDPQCSTYYAAAERVYKEKPAGIMYFVNVKPQLRPLKATPIESRKYTKETAKEPSRLYADQRDEDESPEGYLMRLAEAVAKQPERYYQMVKVNRLERDIVESETDIWDTAQSIQKANNTNVWLRNPDSCISIIGQTCPFLPVCTHRADINDAGLYRKALVPHEELIADMSGG